MLVTALCFHMFTERRTFSVNTGGFNNMDVPFGARARLTQDQ